MSVSSETNKVIYNCDGSTTVFPYPFKIFEDSDLEVILYTIADGTETILTLTTDYTVSGAGDEAGGNVTTTSAYSSDYQLIIKRNIPYTQPVDYSENDPFPAETHEEALDRLTFLTQQLKGMINRALLQDESKTEPLDVPMLSAGKYLYTDGTSLSWSSVSTTDAQVFWVDAADYGSLSAAVAAIGSNNRVLLIRDEQTVSEDLTIPSNICLFFARPGKITVSAGVTLTINGAIKAGLYQIFDGDGTVSGSPKIEAVYPEWFGAAGDGTTDDTEAIQAAVDLAESVQCSVLFVSESYKLSSGLSIAADKISLISFNKSILDFSSVTSSTSCISVTGYTGDINNSPHMNKHKIAGLILKGPGTGVSDVIGIDFSPSSGYSSFYKVENCAIGISPSYGFSIGIKIYSNVWCNVFNNCSFRNDLNVYMPSGGSNYGERITFINCTFYNSTEAIKQENANGNFQFIGCSFDYIARVFTVTGGRVYVANCHIESNKDTDYMFYVSGNGSILSILNSEIVITGDHTSYELGYCDSSVSLGGIAILDCFLSIATYSLQKLIDGEGSVKVRNLQSFQYDEKPCISESLNILADGGFESGFDDWVAPSDAPTIDTSVYHSGSQSLKFAVNSEGNTCSIYRDFDVNPQDRIVLSYWLKTENVSGSHFYISFNFYDKAGNSLFAGTADITTDFDWTLRKQQISLLAPKGTVSGRISFSTGASFTSKKVWLDDVIINIIES